MKKYHFDLSGPLLVFAAALLGCLIVIWMGGCAIILDEATAPEVRQVIVATSLDVTYQRATRTASRMGGTLLAYDPKQYTFTAQVKKAIALHVDVRRVAEGTQMTVTGTILPKELTFGMITEVDEFLIMYRNEGI